LLRREIASAKATQAALPHLKRALGAIAANDYKSGLKAVTKAVTLDPNNFLGHHRQAIAQEKLGDWAASIDAYERALTLKPESPEIANDLGRLAFRMGMLPQAEILFRHHLALRPYAIESSNNLACVLRDQQRYDEAIELLKPALQSHPQCALLWNTLGTVMSDMGECEQAAVFFTETLRLDPKHAKARYNRANCLFTLGDSATAVEDCRAAMAGAESPEDLATMGLALSSMLLASGDLSQGWEAYEARLSPHFHDPIHYLVNRPLWTPDTDIEGRHLLLIGEQGLGDEIMFSNMIDDILEALGPAGRLSMTVDRRLVPLFQRSFPRVNVGIHNTFMRNGRNIRMAPGITDWADIDYYAPLGQPLRRFRNRIEDFPERPQGFMKADPERVAYWRAQFADHPGPKIGLLWTSMLINSSRRKYFPPFDQWGPILTQPGATFVNLQYGDRSADIQMARDAFGIEILQPEGIDLKADLDDVAALCCAMDLVLGPANATSNIAAACGAPNWLIAAPGAWPQLGTDRYPFYSQTKVFATESFGDWSPVLAKVGSALADFIAAHAPQAKAG
jgi:Tfp pilus assembly protein PilF